MRLIGCLIYFIVNFRPSLFDLIDNFTDSYISIFGWSKVPCFGKFFPAFQKLLTEEQISAQRFKNMLPGACGMWIPDLYFFF